MKNFNVGDIFKVHLGKGNYGVCVVDREVIGPDGENILHYAGGYDNVLVTGQRPCGYVRASDLHSSRKYSQNFEKLVSHAENWKYKTGEVYNTKPILEESDNPYTSKRLHDLGEIIILSAYDLGEVEKGKPHYPNSSNRLLAGGKIYVVFSKKDYVNYFAKMDSMWHIHELPEAFLDRLIVKD